MGRRTNFELIRSCVHIFELSQLFRVSQKRFYDYLLRFFSAAFANKIYQIGGYSVKHETCQFMMIRVLSHFEGTVMPHVVNLAGYGICKPRHQIYDVV